MSDLVSNINRRIDSIAATEKLRMLTTEEINCQALLKQLADHIAELEKDKAELVQGAELIINMYIRNQGTDSEFITCITPRGAYGMTRKERKTDETWRAFDKIRELVAKSKP